MKYKPSVVGKSFKVKDGDPEDTYYISAHETLPDYFRVYGGFNLWNFGYKKTTVWEEIDRGQWILQ